MSETEEKAEVATPENEERKETSQEDSGIEKDVEKLSVEDGKPDEEIGTVWIIMTRTHLSSFYFKILISMTRKSKLLLLRFSQLLAKRRHQSKGRV